MTVQTYPYKKSQVSYAVFGTGNQPVICFHGYGESANSFFFLEKYALESYCFIAIDLPYHGQTEWEEGLYFTNEDLLNITKGILEKSGFKASRSFTVMGYSLGGRISLSLYQMIPNQVKRVVLLAPDGLKVNFWYWLSTQTLAGNKLFHFTMKHPEFFLGFLNLINKLKLVNQSIFKFVHYYLKDEQARWSLYNRWTCLRKIKPDLSSVKKSCIIHRTAFYLLYGRHDKIILPRRGELFRKGIEAYCEIRVIPAGHQVLHEKYITEIKSALQQPGQ